MEILNLQGNWVDLVILFILFFYLLSGWGRGFFLGTLDLFGFIVSFIAALTYYMEVGLLLRNNFTLPKGIANALGFFTAGILSEFIYSLLANFIVNNLYSKINFLINNKRKINLLKSLNKWLGIFPAIGEALIFTAFVLTLLITLPVQGRIKKDVSQSKIGSILIHRTQGIEGILNTVFGEAVNETLTFLTINPNPTSQESLDLGFTQTEGKLDIQAENSMLTLVNIERQKNNLPPLASHDALKELSRKYAHDMFERGFFSHYNPEGQSPFDRMRQANISFLAAGENLALAPNVVLAHQGLMNSPGHRANILSSDFDRVGIGVIDGGIYGMLFVQEFIN